MNPIAADFPMELRLYTSVLMGKNFVMSLTKKALNWRRTIRLQGGYWLGTFQIVAPMAELVDYFYNWLGWHFEESVQGTKSWEGMIYEMVLNTPNASRVRSFDQMYNIGRVKYVDGAGADQMSAVASSQASQDRYGRRTFRQDVGTLGAAAAAAMGARYLAEHAWPWARPQASGGQEGYSLEVTVCGYIFTANWRINYVSSPATSTIHDQLQSAITTFCTDYLLEGTLAANTTSVERIVADEVTNWTLMLKLIQAGDASGNLYRGYVANDRYFYYEQLSKTPIYYIVKGKLASSLESSEAMNPWLVRPGVFRDMDYPVSHTEPGSYLDDLRDMIVEEVSVGASSGLTWQALDFSESAQLAAFQELSAGVDRVVPGGGGNAGGGSRGGGDGGRTISDAQLAKWGISRQEWWRIKATPEGKLLRATMRKKKSEKRKNKR